jgi:hypothetical protein
MQNNPIQLYKTKRSMYIFIYSLFNDALSNSGYIRRASNGGMIVNNELERMYKEVAVV